MLKQELKSLIVETYQNIGLLNDGRVQLGLNDLCGNDDTWLMLTKNKDYWHLEALFDYKESQLTIKELSTRPAQGLGNGGKLLRACQDIATTTGIDLSIVPTNHNIGFWKHMGYKLIREQQEIIDERLKEVLEKTYLFPAYKYLD